MTHTPQSIAQALVDIAQTIAEGYDTQIKALPPEAKTEKKALTIQKEMASLCIRCGLLAHSAQMADMMEKRMLTPAPQGFLARIDDPCYKAFCDMSPADREVVTPYIHGLYFMADQFLIQWKSELTRAEAAEDTAGVFELNLKLGTVLRVLTSWEAWWQCHAKELPALPPMSAMEELLHE